MDTDDHGPRHVLRKIVLQQPPSYIGFSDASLVRNNNLKRRKTNPPTLEIFSARSPRSGVSPVKKIAKLDDISDEVKNEKNNHQYITEQKKKWRQKIKNEEELKKNLSEKKKQSLQDLQIKSKILLKRNLNRKSLKSKSINKSSPTLLISTVNNSDFLESTPNKEETKSKSKMVEIIHTENVIKAETNPTNIIQSPDMEAPLMSPQESITNEDKNISPKSAAIRIQSSYRGYRARKILFSPKSKSNKNNITAAVDLPSVDPIIEADTKSQKSSTNVSIDYPYNFIGAVKTKLLNALDTPSSRSDEKNLSAQNFSISPLEKLRKECIANPSFFTLYKNGLDSVYVMPTVGSYPDSPYNKPFLSETSSVLKQFDAKINNSCEFSVYQKASNLTALSDMKHNSGFHREVNQKSTVISELKSSLQEIQNLTVSITFNEKINNTNPKFKTVYLGNSLNKTKDAINKSSGNLRSSNEYIESNVSEDNAFSKANILNSPDINLIWSRKANAPKQKQSEEKPNHFQSQFNSELSLLDSFNESLRQVQAVEEALTSVRRHSNLSNTSLLTDCSSEVVAGDNLLPVGDLFNINSSCEVSANTHISRSINGKDISNKFSVGHESRGITINSRNTTNRSINLCKQNQITDIMNSLKDISRGSELLRKKLDSEVINSAFKTKKDSSRSCSVERIDITPLQESLSFPDSVLDSETSLKDVTMCDDIKLANHLNKFCVCLITQYIEDEKVRSEYLNTLLKVREKTLVDATRLELMCLQMQKKQNLELVPLLKKRQRGLLLKSQQERNEIKHIQKFQQEQSQERKATLKRQLKHLKKMFSCQGNVIDLKKKNNVKNSSLLLQSKSGPQYSPVKVINFSFSESNASNSAYCELRDNLEKKKIDLIQRKKKLDDLLHMHYDVQLDATEVKLMEHRLLRREIALNKIDTLSTNICTKDKVDKSTLGYVATEDVKTLDSRISIKNIDETLETCRKFAKSECCEHNLINENDRSSSELLMVNNFTLSGNSLNKLWEKITSNKTKKYIDDKMYTLSKESLDHFFEEAKQLALKDLLKSLQCNTSHGSQDKISHSELSDDHSSILQCSHEKSSDLVNCLSNESDKPVNEQEKCKELNVIETSEEMNSYAETVSPLQDNILSETFTIKENTTYPSDHTESSNSTAHSLVEELTRIDTSVLNDHFENEEVGDFKQNVPCTTERQSVITKSVVCSPSKYNLKPITISNSTQNEVIEKTDVEDDNKEGLIFLSDTNASNLIDSSKSYKCCKLTENFSKPDKTENKMNKVELTNQIVNTDIDNVQNNKTCQERVENINLRKNIDSLTKMTSPGDVTYVSTLEASIPVKRSYPENKIESLKVCTLMEDKANFTDLLSVQDAVTPSPDQSPRDSPTGEYSPAAVSLSACRIDEAEELRKKQLAIELEIKALEQQSQLPFCLVREIPDKPPPPYIPPSEESNKLNVIVSPRGVVRRTTPEAIHTIESYCNWLWNQFSSGNTENITFFNFSKGDESSLKTNNNVYIFDICHEIFEEEFAEMNIADCQLWEFNQKNPFKLFGKDDVCGRVEKKVKEIVGLENDMLKENLIINWAHKRHDHVNYLLIKELYKEEVVWVNIEENEIDVKNELTNTILDKLILEACLEYKSLY